MDARTLAQGALSAVSARVASVGEVANAHTAVADGTGAVVVAGRHVACSMVRVAHAWDIAILPCIAGTAAALTIHCAVPVSTAYLARYGWTSEFARLSREA